jgi:glycine dehydrogenase subunit 1
MRYIPNSAEQRAEMLREIGCQSIDDLFQGIPINLRLKGPLALPAAQSEIETLNYFRELAARNTTGARMPLFLGAGAYDHFIPTIIDTLISRSEFYTSYTPYQPEISQGTLQAIFEFQSMICELTGLDVANASLYDGSTAMAEAVLMAERVTGRSKVAIAGNVHPEYREVVETYIRHAGISSLTLATDPDSGTLMADSLADLDQETAAVVVQSPNFFGGIEQLEGDRRSGAPRGCALCRRRLRGAQPRAAARARRLSGRYRLRRSAVLWHPALLWRLLLRILRRAREVSAPDPGPPRRSGL